MTTSPSMARSSFWCGWSLHLADCITPGERQTFCNKHVVCKLSWVKNAAKRKGGYTSRKDGAHTRCLLTNGTATVGKVKGRWGIDSFNGQLCWSPYYGLLSRRYCKGKKSMMGNLWWEMHQECMVMCAEALLPLAIAALFSTGGSHDSPHAKWGKAATVQLRVNNQWHSICSYIFVAQLYAPGRVLQRWVTVPRLMTASIGA